MKRLSIYLLWMLPLIAFTHVLYRSDSLPHSPGDFDFWIGDWELSWNDSLRGTNTITRELNGFVICEHFDNPAGKYVGRSWSVFDPVGQVWRQTWVDNQGAYLDLTGGMKDGRMILQRSGTDKKGNPIQQRMIFYNISRDDFDWQWESSADGGNNWKINWKIHYQRQIPK